jgi:hypothetical protein
MKLHTLCTCVLLLALVPAVVAKTAVAQTAPAPTSLARQAVPCHPATRGCPRYKHLLTYPAHALSYSNTASFVLHQRGVNWVDKNGVMSLTVHRPADYTGGSIRLTFFHQILDDGAGDLKFHVTPMTFNSGNNFETYGSVGTNLVVAPENLGTLLQQSVLISPGNGFSADGSWWYFDLVRAGSFSGGLRMMSVALEY